jgi:hypothetical protein
VVDLDSTLWSFDVDGRGGGDRLCDVCVAGIGKGDFLAGTSKRFDNELLVVRDDVDGCKGFAKLLLGTGTAATFFMLLDFGSLSPDVCFARLVW